MAELYLDDTEFIKRSMRTLTSVTKKPVTTPAPAPKPVKTDAQKDAELGITRAPVTSVVDERTQLQAKGVIPKPTITPEERAAQLKKERETKYFEQQAKLKGEKPTVPPEDDNFKYDYTWITLPGGGGEWRLIKTAKIKGVSTGGSTGGSTSGSTGGSGASTGGDTTVSTGPTTNVDVLKSLLRGMGFTSSLIDSSADFLNRLLKDGLSYDNAIAIFLDSKEYTFKDGKKTTSPFYTAYGYLNEGLVVPKSAAELYNAVEGYKGVVSKYNLNEKYISQDSLKKYVKNNVSVSELDERANAARLKAVNADPYYVQALMKLGYVKEATDLTDFFLNPEIGKEALEQNRSTAAFSTEAIRRSQQGLAFSGERFKQLTAGLLGQGLSEQQIGAMAATGFESIAQSLRPTQKLAGIYEGAPQGGEVDQIQKELEAEQFLGTASQRRKRLAEMELAAFQRSAGTTTVSQRRPTAGII
jgi:hypothetical protein